MSLILLRNLDRLIAFALGIGLAWYVGHMVYDARVQKLKHQREVALESQRVSLTDEFNKLKAQTDALNFESNQRIADLERRVDAARRLYKPAPCIPVRQATSTQSSSNPADIQRGYVQYGYGVDADALISYFRLAEQIRVSQDICRKQMDEIYK